VNEAVFGVDTGARLEVNVPWSLIAAPTEAVVLIVTSKVNVVGEAEETVPPAEPVAPVPSIKVIVEPETSAWSLSVASVLAPLLGPVKISKLLAT